LFPLQARVAINDLELAKKDFELVLQVEPNNREAQQQLNVLIKRIKQHVAKEKVIFGEFYRVHTEQFYILMTRCDFCEVKPNQCKDSYCGGRNLKSKINHR